MTGTKLIHLNIMLGNDRKIIKLKKPARHSMQNCKTESEVKVPKFKSINY